MCLWKLLCLYIYFTIKCWQLRYIFIIVWGDCLESGNNQIEKHDGEIRYELTICKNMRSVPDGNNCHCFICYDLKTSKKKKHF